MRSHARSMGWVRVAVCLVGVLLAYYTAPVGWTDGSLGLALVGTVGGVALLAWAIVGQVRRQVAGERAAAVPTLVTLVLVVMAVFAWSYVALETARPGQMDGLATRTDALYFTMQVLSTVGLGDVHAVGQAARGLVTLQMAFDLVFIAAAGSAIAASVRSRVGTVATSPGPGDPSPSHRTDGGGVPGRRDPAEEDVP